MRSAPLSGLASRFFGISVLGLTFVIVRATSPSGEADSQSSCLGIRAEVLDEPEHQSNCPTCQIIRELEKTHRGESAW